KGCHLDTVELLDDKESIKIEDVRKLIERANMTSQSKYKIFLIQSIERMTTEAANSFLKILEEPPVGTVFILTTNTLRGILPTVVSRTRVIKFGSVSVSFLEKTLKELYPDFDEETIRNVSLLSLGKTGKAVHLMENPDALAVTMKAYHDIQNLLDHKNIVDRFGYVEEISDDFSQAETFLNVLSHVLRSRMIEGTESERHISALQKVDEAGVLLKKNINSKLVLENLMLFL
ncbi:hypothetical protein HZC20_02000, partial [Candidatus Peregrinibacteria bacterium]|nr:hypothetical protein [Candidatus Peregrinibacteria bacterium]